MSSSPSVALFITLLNPPNKQQTTQSPPVTHLHCPLLCWLKLTLVHWINSYLFMLMSGYETGTKKLKIMHWQFNEVIRIYNFVL